MPRPAVGRPGRVARARAGPAGREEERGLARVPLIERLGEGPQALLLRPGDAHRRRGATQRGDVATVRLRHRSEQTAAGRIHRGRHGQVRGEAGGRVLVLAAIPRPEAEPDPGGRGRVLHDLLLGRIEAPGPTRLVRCLDAAGQLRQQRREPRDRTRAVGQLRSAAHQRPPRRPQRRPAIAIDDDREQDRGPVAVRQEARRALGQRGRVQAGRAVRRVDGHATAPGLVVDHVARRHEGPDVGDGVGEHEGIAVAFIVGGQRHGLVEVGRTGGVEGDERQRAGVVTIGRQGLAAGLVGRGHDLGREGVGYVVLPRGSGGTRRPARWRRRGRCARRAVSARRTGVAASPGRRARPPGDPRWRTARPATTTPTRRARPSPDRGLGAARP